jgi:hypothetical protein
MHEMGRTMVGKAARMNEEACRTCWTRMLTLSVRITVRWPEMNLRETPVSVRALHIRRVDREYLRWIESSQEAPDTIRLLLCHWKRDSKHASPTVVG